MMEAGKPVLIRVMNEKRAFRDPAALTLKKIGVPAESVIPSLLEALRNEQDLEPRLRTIWLMGFLGPYASPAAPELLQLLGDGNPKIRFQSRQALLMIGAAGIPDGE